MAITDIEAIFRAESRYAMATLCRVLGNFDLAEDSLQEAFTNALVQWPRDGVPNNPRSWLISTARFKAIDHLRRERRLVHSSELETQAISDVHELEEIPDDLLRLIFMCCHPDLSIEAQVALTLREVCGLSTPEIARAFLLPEATLAQRIVRAKSKLRQSRAAFEVPAGDELPTRLSSVLRVIYLVFNEGYYASSGESLTSAELSAQALRLGELLASLLPEPEVFGLVALMNFSDSRRAARTHGDEIVLLEDQDRSLWNQAQVAAGNANLSRALDAGPAGYYTLQALLASEHTNAPSSAETNWARIVEWYDQLDGLHPTPVIKLNRAVAVAMSGEIDEGLRLINNLLQSGDLKAYSLAHAARANLLQRRGQVSEARNAYQLALELTNLDPERRFLEQKIRHLDEM